MTLTSARYSSETVLIYLLYTSLVCDLRYQSLIFVRSLPGSESEYWVLIAYRYGVTKSMNGAAE